MLFAACHYAARRLRCYAMLLDAAAAVTLRERLRQARLFEMHAARAARISSADDIC